MAKKYKGTKITGTSKTAKVFKKSGIKKAAKGDTYFNTSSGHNYKCTTGGDAKTAKWKYTKTSIIKKPNIALSNLTVPSRSTYTFTSSWGIPGDLTKDTNCARMTKIYTVFNVGGTKTAKKLATNATSDAITLTRSNYYPFSGKPTLGYINFWADPWNKKGQGSKPTSQQLNFGKPRAPELGDFAFDDSTGILSIVCKTNAGTDAYERYDTAYKVTVKNTRVSDDTYVAQNSSSTSTEFTISFDASDYQQLTYDQYIRVQVDVYSRGFAGDSGTVTKVFYIAYPSRTTIEEVEVTSKDSNGKCTVYISTNQVNNDAGEIEHPTDKIVLEYLANCTYKKADEIPGDSSWSSSNIQDNGFCTAMSMPVTQLIPDAGKYTWVRVVSYHASENVLYRYSNYMRVKGLETPVISAEDDYIVILEAITGVNGTSALVRLGWNADGEDDSTGTELTWSDEEDTWMSTDEPDSHEFTWSDGPIYVLTEDTTPAAGKDYYSESGGVYTKIDPAPANPKSAGAYEMPYHDSATIIIKGLEESTKYYIRARRYMEGETVTYSPYSNQETVLTSETPEAVIATASSYVAEGASLPVSWTFTGNGLQTAWRVVQDTVYTVTEDTSVVVPGRYEATTDTTVSGSKTYYELVDGEFDAVTPAGTENPSEEGWYEKIADVEKIYYKYQNGEYIEVTPVGTENPHNEGWYEKSGGAVLAEDEGPIGSTQIEADRIAEFAEDNELRFHVEVSTGSGFVMSESHKLTIIDPPTLSITVGATCTAQPFSFSAESSRECDLTVIVSANGAAGQRPEGLRRQTVGDTIWSDVVSPVWTAGLTSFTATVTLPSGLDLWDGAAYTISAVATDILTGLQSEERLGVFAVNWTNKAAALIPAPEYEASTDVTVDDNKTYYKYEDGEYVVVEPVGSENPSTEGWYEEEDNAYIHLTPVDEVDEEGFHHQAVQIDLTPPTGSNLTDVYDIYRVTGDGVYPIGIGYPLTYTATDEYAPFGDGMTQYYRIALRTVDGSVSFDDFEYYLPGAALRLDWRDGTLELPYDISIADKYKKDVDVRKHIDGSTDAYWNENIERSGSLNSDVIRLESQGDIELARHLGRYAGAVFVRTPDGSAYEADAQVSQMSTAGVLEAIAIDAQEVGLTTEFILPPWNEEE